MIGHEYIGSYIIPKIKMELRGERIQFVYLVFSMVGR
jgi:hypothetical protein